MPPLQLPPFVFGAMARSGSTDAQRLEVLTTALDLGVRAIDTAPLYDYGNAERQIAAALRQRPNADVQIFTKVGLRWDDDSHGEVLYSFNNAQGKRLNVRKNSRPASIKYEVEQSLLRLNLETLDLVQVHHPDLHTPIAESMGALLDLQAAGKVRHIGISNYSPDQVREAVAALGNEPLAVVQQGYSLLQREPEKALLPLCTACDIDVLAYSPLAGGELLPRAGRSQSKQAQRLVSECLVPMADRHQVAPAAIAWAWVLAQPGVTAVIAGASTVPQLEQLLAGGEVELSIEELDLLERCSRESFLMKLKSQRRRVRNAVGRRIPWLSRGV